MKTVINVVIIARDYKIRMKVWYLNWDLKNKQKFDIGKLKK